jgi:ribonuclease-3
MPRPDDNPEQTTYETGDLEAVQEKLGYRFRDPGLLVVALTHSSAKGEDRPSNERLEFLGDAILGAIVAEYLHDALPDTAEGELTRLKSVVVNSRQLAQVTERLDLLPHITVGKGIAVSRQLPRSLAGNVFESVVAAIHLDRGFEQARTFVLRCLHEDIKVAMADPRGRNFKSLLQQEVQKLFGSVPTYRVVSEAGPDHLKSFEVVAEIEGQAHGVSRGRTKKEAEQKAARLALENLLADGDGLAPTEG